MPDGCVHTIHSPCGFSVTSHLILTLSMSGGFDVATVVIILHCFEEFRCLEFTSSFGDYIMFNDGVHPDAFPVLELVLKFLAIINEVACTLIDIVIQINELDQVQG